MVGGYPLIYFTAFHTTKIYGAAFRHILLPHFIHPLKETIYFGAPQDSQDHVDHPSGLFDTWKITVRNVENRMGTTLRFYTVKCWANSIRIMNRTSSEFEHVQMYDPKVTVAVSYSMT